ncbi:hypothetical protein HII36_54825 [Nonomuraea sp. NN258]|uniref:hypothetical protein n=1 Tax=Nonomuraea antri TaxID=2730852 RepID=UPI00156A1D01|nr:hypothetical protein [Nonomuraea antri]NRQ40823.1 hypothetical protein [Nonomuraea antri]
MHLTKIARPAALLALPAAVAVALLSPAAGLPLAASNGEYEVKDVPHAVAGRG